MGTQPMTMERIQRPSRANDWYLKIDKQADGCKNLCNRLFVVAFKSGNPERRNVFFPYNRWPLRGLLGF